MSEINFSLYADYELKKIVYEYIQNFPQGITARDAADACNAKVSIIKVQLEELYVLGYIVKRRIGGTSIFAPANK